MMFVDFPADGLHAVINRHFHVAAAQVAVWQRDMHSVHIGNHAFGEGLQENFSPVLCSIAVKRLTAGSPAEFTGGSHQQKFCTGRNFGFDKPGNFRYIQIRRNEA